MPRCAGRWGPPSSAGMLGVTLFGIFLTPVFYYVIQWFGQKKQEPTPGENHEPPKQLELVASAPE